MLTGGKPEPGLGSREDIGFNLFPTRLFGLMGVGVVGRFSHGCGL